MIFNYVFARWKRWPPFSPSTPTNWLRSPIWPAPCPTTTTASRWFDMRHRKSRTSVLRYGCSYLFRGWITFKAGMHNIRPAGQMWPAKAFYLARNPQNLACFFHKTSFMGKIHVHFCPWEFFLARLQSWVVHPCFQGTNLGWLKREK